MENIVLESERDAFSATIRDGMKYISRFIGHLGWKKIQFAYINQAKPTVYSLSRLLHHRLPTLERFVFILHIEINKITAHNDVMPQYIVNEATESNIDDRIKSSARAMNQRALP